ARGRQPPDNSFLGCALGAESPARLARASPGDRRCRYPLTICLPCPAAPVPCTPLPVWPLCPLWVWGCLLGCDGTRSFQWTDWQFSTRTFLDAVAVLWPLPCKLAQSIWAWWVGSQISRSKLLAHDDCLSEMSAVICPSLPSAVWISIRA